MKTILALLILMIGLVVMPPGPVKSSPVVADQISFVANDLAPVAVMQAQEKGGEKFVQSYKYNAMPVIYLASEAVIDDETYTIVGPANYFVIPTYTKHVAKLNHPPLYLKSGLVKTKDLVLLQGKISSATSV
jgi:hypothetical protein